MDLNGYNESIFDTEDGVCYITGRRTETARHEIFNKYSRDISKREGFWIAVCPEAHERIHRNDGGIWDELKKAAEIKYLVADWNRTIGQFVELIGRNYLE